MQGTLTHPITVDKTILIYFLLCLVIVIVIDLPFPIHEETVSCSLLWSSELEQEPQSRYFVRIYEESIIQRPGERLGMLPPLPFTRLKGRSLTLCLPRMLQHHTPAMLMYMTPRERQRLVAVAAIVD